MGYPLEGINVQTGTNNVNTNNQAQQYYNNLGIVPDSPGVHLPGTSTNYNQSAWFDTQAVADPTLSSQIAKGQIGSHPLQNLVPLLNPIGYNF